MFPLEVHTTQVNGRIYVLLIVHLCLLGLQWEKGNRELHVHQLNLHLILLLVIEDFEEVDGLAEFSPNQEEILVSIPLTDDVFPEEMEQFEVILAASPGVFVDSPARAVVTILNDDPEFPGKNLVLLTKAVICLQYCTLYFCSDEC